MYPFRIAQPQRTCNVKYSNYRQYKSFLASDFNNRCGYTDCNDFWFGGKNNFHIDHFIPWKGKSNAEQLKCDYQNLVYCCSYVNIVKSNDEGSYLDPCNVDLNDHFYRDKLGCIFPRKTSLSAIYMYDKLRLYLKRYQIIWMLDQLEDRMNKLYALEESVELSEDCRDLIVDLNREYIKYKKYLRAL